MADTAFEQLVSLLPLPLRDQLLCLPNEKQQKTYEIRLRAEKAVVLFGAFGSVVLLENGRFGKMLSADAVVCSAKMLEEAFLRLCDYSVHAHTADLVQGFVTARGGHRVGVAATAVANTAGSVCSVRDITSLNLRVARTVFGAADGLMGLIEAKAGGLLLAGAPASGKTTMLRDLIGKLSSFQNNRCQKVCVIDERQELDARKDAVNCDYLRAFPKAQAIVNALKTLSPEWIICDELACEKDLEAVRVGMNAGVRFAASVHASSIEELRQRTLVRQLLSTGAFDRVVLLHGPDSPCTIRRILCAKELSDA